MVRSGDCRAYMAGATDSAIDILRLSSACNRESFPNVSTEVNKTVSATGQTKEEQPIAIRLHGGDAVIMSGPARMCYHGVPRVFAEDGTPGDGARDTDSGKVEYEALAEHMRSTRINISIRASR